MFPPQGIPQTPGLAGTLPVAAAPLPGGFTLDLEEIKRQAAEVAQQMRSNKPSDFFTFQEGENYVRLLGPWSQAAADRKEWTKYRATHYQLVGNQRASCYEISHPGLGFVCPVCQVIKAFQPYMTDTLDRMVASPARHANGIVYDADEARNLTYRRLKPFVIKLPLSVYTQLMQLMCIPGVGAIFDVNTGWIVRVIRPATFQGKNQYSSDRWIQGPLGTPETTSQILGQMHDLDRFADFGIPTVEKLQIQLQLAQALMQSCCAAIAKRPEELGIQPPQLVVPPAVYEAHGGPGAAVASPGFPAAPPAPVAPPAVPAQPAIAPMPPLAPPVAAPAVVPPVAAAAAAPTTPPLTTPAFPPAPAAGAMGGLPGMVPPMPPALSAARPAAVPTAAPPPPGAPAAAAPPLAPPPVIQPAPVVPPAPAAPSLPTIPPPPAGTTAPPAGPAPVALPPPPTTAASVPAAAPVTEADGSAVNCPVCGKACKGTRGLKMHLARSPQCSASVPATTAQPEAPAVAEAPVPPTPPVALLPQVGADGKMSCLGNYAPGNMLCANCTASAECIALSGQVS